MLRAASFTTAERWEQPECPLTDERINEKVGHTDNKYHSVLKGKEILTQDTTWMNPEDIILREKNSHNRTNTGYFHLFKVPRGNQL